MRRARLVRAPGEPLVHEVAPGARVDRLELFFDLVFVFAFLTITRSVAGEVTVAGLLKGFLILALLWRAWCDHTMVANRVRLGEGVVPAVVLAAMAAVFVIALSIPQAFGNRPGGLDEPLVFAGGYLVMRLVHLVLHGYIARDDPPLRRQLRRVAASMLVAVVLLVLSGLLPEDIGRADQWAVRLGLWALAVAVEYGWGLRTGSEGWQITSAGHWVERFELILIVAFGETLVAIGIGSELTGRSITWLSVLTSVVAIGVLGSLWWSYFDLVGPAALTTMHGTHGRARVALARDAYAYLYLPMIAGLIGVALGGEAVLRHLGVVAVDPDAPQPGPGIPLLYGGVALYLLGLVGFQARALGTLVWTRPVTIALLLALTPVAPRLPALVALAMLVVICAGLVAAELVLLRTSRRALRAAVRRERSAHEARETQWRREPYR